MTGKYPSPVYEIRVEGELDEDYWADFLEGMAVEPQGNETVISGPVVDQAALYGLLSRLRDLALTLVALRRL